MGSLCMPFETHAHPLTVSLSLSLSTHTQRNVTQRKRVSLSQWEKHYRLCLLEEIKSLPILQYADCCNKEIGCKMKI